MTRFFFLSALRTPLLSHESAPMPPPHSPILAFPLTSLPPSSDDRSPTPFPIQAMTVPDALAGRDLCGKAPTGSGKTLAFGLGAIARLKGKQSRPGHPRVLVLTPTRELCAQVATEIETLASARNLKVASFYGGVGYGPQLKSLARGVDVAVACPGRLTDLIERRSIHLDNVEIVVIDEADRMADMGFLPDVRRLLDKTPESRQTLLFSATLDGDIDVLVRRYQKNPARHEIEADRREHLAGHHVFWKVAAGDRMGTAADIVTASGPTIIFCRTKHATDRMARQLEPVVSGPRRSTGTAARSSASGRWLRSCGAMSTPWWRPTWPLGASTSTGSRPSSTSTRRPTPRTTCIAPVGRPEPALLASS